MLRLQNHKLLKRTRPFQDWSYFLLTKLMNGVTGALLSKLKLAVPRCYSDSQLVLCWIKHEDRVWKRFVQNCVTTIRRLVLSEHWNHCSGTLNPADIPSKVTSMTELSSSSLRLDVLQWLISGIDHECMKVPISEDCWRKMMGITDNMSTKLKSIFRKLIS